MLSRPTDCFFLMGVTVFFSTLLTFQHISCLSDIVSYKLQYIAVTVKYLSYFYFLFIYLAQNTLFEAVMFQTSVQYTRLEIHHLEKTLVSFYYFQPATGCHADLVNCGCTILKEVLILIGFLLLLILSIGQCGIDCLI